MNLTEEYINTNIEFADCYSNEYPEAYNGVLELRIEPTGMLEKEMDKVRKAKGLVPFFDCSGEYDADRWYNFDVFCEKDNFVSLTCTIGDCEEDDDGTQGYYLALSEETGDLIYKRVRSLIGEEKWNEIFN